MGNVTARVARGEQADNVLDQIEEYYGFVSSITPDVDVLLTEISGDTDPNQADDESLDEADYLLTAPGRWIIDFECLDADWFDTVWLKEMQDQGGSQLQAALAGASFESLFLAANSEQATLFYRMHAAYLQRELQPGDEAPVSLLHVVINPDQWGREELREAGWYRFYLGPPDDYQPVRRVQEAETGRGVLTELALPNMQKEIPPTLRRMERLRVPEDPTAEILRALHFPQLPVEEAPISTPGSPGVAGPPGTSSGGGALDTGASEPQRVKRKPVDYPENDDEGFREDGPPLVEPVSKQRIPEMARTAADWLRECWERLADWLRPPGPPLAPAGWAGSLPWPVPLPESKPRRQPVLPAHQLYVGAPSQGVLPRMPNPMAQLPGVQPLVAILNVGQGNSNQLFDQAHKIVCYYDYGSPLHNYLGTAPNVRAGCLHDDPLMVLSHWDYDHYGMARRNPYAYQLRWVAPQQHMGSASSRDVYSQILAMGGSIHLWPGALVPVVQTMSLPWGFLQRGIIRRQLGAGSHQMNDGGIVMYVCVQDGAPGGGAGPAWPAAFGDRTAPVLPSAAVNGLLAAAPLLNLVSRDIAQAANEAIQEASLALGQGIWGIANEVALAADTARQSAIWGAHWGTVWWALRGIGGANPNQVAVGANLVLPPLFPPPAAGTRCQAAFAAPAALLAGAGLNGALGLANTMKCLAAAAVTDAALARTPFGGNLVVARAAARNAVRVVLQAHVKAALAAAPPPPYPAAPPVPAVAFLPVANAAAQFLPAERYILLTGDVAVAYIPAQIANVRPVVVGLTPTHHGARTCFPHAGSRLKQDEAVCRIPWAPGSPAAQAAGAAWNAVQNALLANPLANYVPAAIVAAAAAYALKEVLVGVGGVAGAINWAHLALAANNGILAGAANNGRANLQQLGGATVGAAGAALFVNMFGVGGSAGAAVQANRPGLAATQGAVHSNASLAAAVILADTIAVVFGAVLGPNLEDTAIQAARQSAWDMRFALNHPMPAAWPVLLVPAPARTVALVAGNYAQVPSAAIRAAVRPWRSAQLASPARRPLFLQEGNRSGAQALAAADLAPSGKVAYSYGILGAAHLYPSGGFGHPHPLAVLEYEARGWGDRYNTSAAANVSAQPYAPAPPGGAMGNPIALGWEVVPNQPLTGGGGHTIQVTACPFCATVTNNC